MQGALFGAPISPELHDDLRASSGRSVTQLDFLKAIRILRLVEEKKVDKTSNIALK